MSIYAYLGCRRCREKLFVKDADSVVHADPERHGQFLEKHAGHDLIYLWEEDEVDGKLIVEWPSFEPSPTGWWSHGNLYDH